MAANTSPDQSNIASSGITSTTATITWTTNVEGINVIEYGTTTAYGSTANIDVSATISNIVATSNSNTSVTISWDLSENATGQVAYGVTSNYGSFTTKEESFSYAHHDQTLTGLQAGTTYHFTVISTDTSGNTSYSTDLTFTTTGPNANPLVISNVTISAITQTGATISWDINPAATGQVEYGVSDGYGTFTTLEPSFLYSHSQSISGLFPGTPYYFIITGADALNNSIISAQYTFTTTADANTPVVSGITASPNSATSEQISWDVFPACTGRVEYGETTAYGTLSTLETGYLSWHSQTLSGLTANTLYHYRILGTDVNFNNVTTADQTFTTGLSGTLTPGFFQETETFYEPLITSSYFGFSALTSFGLWDTATTIACSATYATDDTALVWVSYYSDPDPLSATVSDGTNTYTQVGTELVDTVNLQRWVLFECLNPTAGSYTVTCTFGATTVARGIGVAVYEGLTGSAQDFASNYQSAPATTANAVTSGNVTPTAVPATVIGITFAEGVVTLTEGTGFTSRGAFSSYDTVYTTRSKLEDKQVYTTADVAATFTTTSSSVQSLTFGVVYQNVVDTGTLLPNLFTETELFYAPTLTESNRSHAASFTLFDDIFYAPIVTGILVVDFWQEDEVFFSPTLAETTHAIRGNGGGGWVRPYHGEVAAKSKVADVELLGVEKSKPKKVKKQVKVQDVLEPIEVQQQRIIEQQQLNEIKRKKFIMLARAALLS
jgi:hypothetical protein